MLKWNEGRDKMYLIERIEHETVTGRWQYGSFEEAKRKWISLNESPYLYPLLTVDGKEYTIARAERLFSAGIESKKTLWVGRYK